MSLILISLSACIALAVFLYVMTVDDLPNGKRF